jgi:two-component system chemotaxis sensor kinase CheA
MSEEIDEMAEIINDFLIETTEMIDKLDQSFVELEADRQNQGLIDGIFRSVHTIKGASGFLGYTQMVEVAHAAENVLKKIKDGKILLTPHIMDVLLETVDMIKILLEHIKNRDGLEEDISGVKHRLDEINEGRDKGEDASAAMQETASELIPEEMPPVDIDMDDVEGGLTTDEHADDEFTAGEFSAEEIAMQMMAEDAALTSPSIKPPAEEKKQLGEILIEKGIVSEEDVDNAIAVQGLIKESMDTGDMPRVGEILTSTNKVSREEIHQALNKQSPGEKQSGEKQPEKQQIEQTIRVDVERLDNVLNLVGELVLARNRLMRIGYNLEIKYPDNHDISELTDANAFINVITTDLQLAVMKTRMQPIKKVFNKFPRMVRDMARNLKKEIELKLVGEETELDKSIIEEIGDPLVHLIRNSCDHGVELPAEREAAGKPVCGTITLSAYQEGNNIVLAISDDGKGIGIERLKEKIVENGLAGADDVERMSQKELLDFIFLPGFSTAKVVSDVSGRGVGMDVVKTNISKLKGSISIDTEAGRGTKFFIKLPLTLAIIQALMVGVGKHVYAIPLSSVVETVRLRKSGIKTIRGQETMLLRDEVLPLHRLADRFFIASALGDEVESVYIVVILLGEQKYGIMVDKLFGQEEIVIKSIEGYSSSGDGIAGATITGDGKVVLILDPSVMFAPAARNQ